MIFSYISHSSLCSCLCLWCLYHHCCQYFHRKRNSWLFMQRWYALLTSLPTFHPRYRLTFSLGYIGEACADVVVPIVFNNATSPSSNRTPIIIGASVGAGNSIISSCHTTCHTTHWHESWLISSCLGVLIIILIIVVIVLATRRKPQRGTSTFIPLEKKDFTKIIYGEQLHESPEKHSGDLKQLEQVSNNISLMISIICNLIIYIIMDMMQLFGCFHRVV